jgi:hypothetical protein
MTKPRIIRGGGDESESDLSEMLAALPQFPFTPISDISILDIALRLYAKEHSLKRTVYSQVPWLSRNVTIGASDSENRRKVTG